MFLFFITSYYRIQMDVGEPNFRFTLDEPEKTSRAFRYPMSAELHVSSLDRFNSTPTVSQVIAQLSADYTTTPASYNYSATNCLIQTKKNLLYGYFNRIAISEFQLFLRVPTIIDGVNNQFYLTVYPGGYVPGSGVNALVTIPPGFYTPTLLAVAMQTAIRAVGAPFTNSALFTVTAPNNQNAIAATGAVQTGFRLSTGNTDAVVFAPPPSNGTQALQRSVWKFYRLVGTNALSFTGLTPGAFPSANVATFSPNFLPTDYIDIVSKSLTNWKEVKDTNSSEQAPLGVLGRIYLTEAVSAVQQPNSNGYPDPNALGSAPFAFTKKWATPNWSQWSPNQAIDKIDIQLLDMWGDVLYWTAASSCASTEWEMTLIASE
jgi:hypothetical protein